MNNSLCGNSNISFNLSEFEYFREPTVFKKLEFSDYINICLYVIVIIGAFLGNIGVVLSVTMNRSLRTTINLYIVNLAMADMLICTCCMLSHLVGLITYPLYILGPFMCKFNSFTQMTCLTSSVLTLSAISCDRFVAIFFPLHARITKQRKSVIIFIIWLISLTVSIPFLLVKKHYILSWKNFAEPKCGEHWPEHWTYNQQQNRCIVEYPLQLVYYTFVTVTLFFLPIGIMSTAYSLILWKLWVSKIPGERHASNLQVQQRAKRRVVKMVFLVLVAFIVCWMPFQTILLYSKYGRSTSFSEKFPKLRYYAVFIAYSNSFLNPIIYGGFNKRFRDGMCMILRCRLKFQSTNSRIVHKSRMTFSTGVSASASIYSEPAEHPKDAPKIDSTANDL